LADVLRNFTKLKPRLKLNQVKGTVQAGITCLDVSIDRFVHGSKDVAC